MSNSNKPYAGGSVPENYERYLVPILFADYAKDLSEAVEINEQGAILETACGTGAVTRKLRSRIPDTAKLVVTDLAPAMVAQARQIVGEAPNIEYVEADATRLPFDDNSFDAVCCQFSLMLFPDKRQGMREAARVLKPGGQFVFNVWDKLGRNGFSAAVHEAVCDMFASDPPRFLEAPYAYNDLSDIVQSLQSAGFGIIDIAVMPHVSSAETPYDVAMGLVAGSPLANEIMQRDERSLEETTGAVAATLSEQFGEGPVTAPMQAFQFTAYKNRVN